MRAISTLSMLLVAAATVRAEPAGYEAEVLKWRAGYEAELRADDGWLTVAGLFWLNDGANRVGSAPGSEILLPADAAPAVVGVLELRDGKTTIFKAQKGVAVTFDGAPVETKKLAPDTASAPDVLSLGKRLTFFVIGRGGRLGVRVRDRENPLRKEFKGLSWFPVNPAARVTARFVANPEPKTLAVPNAEGDFVAMSSPGRAVFKIGAEEVGLDAILEGPRATQLFFIFADGTTGAGTYPGGRFLYTDLPKDGAVVLDFNQAHSPPCAYTPHATCPLPPKANKLTVKIEAGEKYAEH